jgi:hypothetical protein
MSIEQRENGIPGKSMIVLGLTNRSDWRLCSFQHVPHVHFHVIPKPNATEGLVITLENWPQKKAENEALAATCAKMKERL